MNSISVIRFRDNLQTYVEQSINDHTPIKVTGSGGGDFIVMSADDWAREQETLYVLQNTSLMQQIADSTTYNKKSGYQPTQEQMDEITNF
ncbi:MAG: type II toxin-antitoxin system Phd/YefM family antitoxin [Psychrosphaera sp.]|nr:type II toxin-antitoxin system Phd/YefM family antitoxin [Psychrosphaera sp.]